MFKKPWKMKEGFLLGAGLLVLGIVLQIVCGPVRWAALAFPVNIILLAVALAAIGVMYALRRRVYLFEWMMHYGAAVPALVYALGLTIVMGLVAQGEAAPSSMADFPPEMMRNMPEAMRQALEASQAAGAMGGSGMGGGSHAMPWLGQMLNFWPFVLAWGWMLLVVGMASLNHLLRWKLREIPFLLNHLGVFVAVAAATLGAPDKQDVLIQAFRDIPENRAVREDGSMLQMDLSIELHKFIMETYPDGSPKRFASDITVSRRDGSSVSGTVDVNKPMKVDGWKIYQYDYDSQAGAESLYSTFELVRDPWLPAVYAGIFMMIAGALCLMLFMAPKPAVAAAGGASAGAGSSSSAAARSSKSARNNRRETL
jgi:hypothetical protein